MGNARNIRRVQVETRGVASRTKPPVLEGTTANYPCQAFRVLLGSISLRLLVSTVMGLGPESRNLWGPELDTALKFSAWRVEHRLSLGLVINIFHFYD